MKESCSLFTVQKHWVKPTPDLNDWSKQKAEAHESMKQTSKTTITQDNTSSLTKTKVSSRTLAVNTAENTYKPAATATTSPTSRCIVCIGNHRFWVCQVFKERTPNQRANIVAQAKPCFSCLREKTFSGNARTPKMQERSLQQLP